MAAGVITEYLGEGLAASRPATPSVGSAIALWWSTDTNEMSAWLENAWVEDVFGGGGGYAPGGTDVALADGGTGATLADPGADRIMFWDDSAGAVDWLTAGTGLTITGTTIAASGGALSSMYEDRKAANTAGGGATSGSWIARTLNTEAYDDIGLALRSSTFTVTLASPGVFSWTAHGLILNSTVIFTTSGALPTGLTAGATYYVISAGLTADAFQVSATAGGAAINTSGSQSGTHTATASQISLAAGTYDVEAESSFYDCDAARTRIRDVTNSVTLALSINVYGSASNNVQANARLSGRFTLAGTATVELQYRVFASAATNGLGVVQADLGEVEVFSRLKLTKLS